MAVTCRVGTRGPPARLSFLRKPAWWLAALAILGGIAAAFYYYGRQPSREQVQSRPAPASQAQPVPKAAVEPAIRHPLPEGQPQFGPAEQLPALDQSDKVLQGVLAELFRSRSLRKLFYPRDMVRRFVVTVDNLPRKKLPLQLRPVKPVVGPFLTAAERTGVAIAPENDRRYAAYVSAAAAVDGKKLVAVYVHFYPLFQQEYRLLGYPSGAFNDRLIEAIDDLLITPDVERPVHLVQPKVMFEFADPGLEALSSGEKIMLRIGSDNAARIKAKLREIRRELTGVSVGNPGR
jgi:DUF3014 family protein